MSSSAELRTLHRGELELMLDWAADEGWNPGLDDAAAFFAADPEGYLGLFVDGELVVTVSIVRYDASFAFAGCYICRPDHRGEGYGLELAQAALSRADVVTIGLDGVLEREQNYERLGFVTAYRSTRFGGEPRPDAAAGSSRRLAIDDLDAIERYERVAGVFPAPRRAFLERWLTAPGSVAYGLGPGAAVDGYGVIRRCRSGHKIGPLFCNTRAEAELLIGTLVRAVDGGLVFLDVPQPNAQAVELVRVLGLRPIFETARMYRGPDPGLTLERVYGSTSFELG
jgi:GNAT superfamily N-acetyltransferase